MRLRGPSTGSKARACGLSSRRGLAAAKSKPCDSAHSLGKKIAKRQGKLELRGRRRLHRKDIHKQHKGCTPQFCTRLRNKHHTDNGNSKRRPTPGKGWSSTKAADQMQCAWCSRLYHMPNLFGGAKNRPGRRVRGNAAVHNKAGGPSSKNVSSVMPMHGQSRERRCSV